MQHLHTRAFLNMVISTNVSWYATSNNLQCCGPHAAFVYEGFFDLTFLNRCPSIQCTTTHDVSCKNKRKKRKHKLQIAWCYSSYHNSIKNFFILISQNSHCNISIVHTWGNSVKLWGHGNNHNIKCSYVIHGVPTLQKLCQIWPDMVMNVRRGRRTREKQTRNKN